MIKVDCFDYVGEGFEKDYVSGFNGNVVFVVDGNVNVCCVEGRGVVNVVVCYVYDVIVVLEFMDDL